MIDRRGFLKSAAIAATAGSGLLTGCQRVARRKEAGATSALASGLMVPDTLDMSDHGSKAVNGILGTMDPELNYEIAFLTILDCNPPYMLHWSTMVSGVMPKYLTSIPMLRLMSGSKQDLDIQNGFMDAMLNNMKGDGLVYDRALPSRPWNVGVYYGKKDWNEDYANMAGNGRMITGLLAWYELTGDGVWLKRARKTAERMLELAIVEGDYAWYPNPGLGNDFSYPRKSGWTTKEPPKDADEGFEGGSMFYLFQPLRGWARYYMSTGDERFLELSRKFARFGLQDKFWSGASDMSQSASSERGHFHLHFHASMAAVRGVLDYALAANDHKAKLFARDSYEFARQTGLHRLGLFPTNGEGTEGCSIADMVGMAVTLTDAGLGDYWDDVEMYARNGLISAQATDMSELRRVVQKSRERPRNADWGGTFDWRFAEGNKGVLPNQEIHDRVLQRTIGQFGHLVGARYQTPMMMHCCTANCCQGLYYVWEGITRKEGDGAVVNMWLNRRSPWLDVTSFLPYEGKLVLQNKGNHRIAVRIPSWAPRREMRCIMNGRDVTPMFRGNRLVFEGLKGNEQITIKAPVMVQNAEYTVVNLATPTESHEQYSIDFKGHTAIDVKRIVAGAGKEDLYWYRIFQRDHMKADKAPMKKMPGYVHDKVIAWDIVR